MSENKLRISVRRLIEFIYRSGDIDDRVGGMRAAQEGTAIHKSIQEELKDQYEKIEGHEFEREQYLVGEFEYEDINLVLEGRADGIIYEETPKKPIKVIEIKSTVKDLMSLEENENFLHWAQGKLYCYIICEEQNLDSIDLDLVYCHRENFVTRTFSKEFTRGELKEFFLSVMARYVEWVRLETGWMNIRRKSIEALEFPFEKYRKGQRELAVNIYRTIKEKKNIYIEAPTGTGKTISTLFPALKSLTINPEAKIVYLTAKNITKTVAESTTEILKENGLKLRTLTITAKDKICFKEERACNGDDCEFARGHFDRVNDAIIDLFENETSITEEVINTYSRKHYVCPFELSLDLIQWCDLIICDYNYFFDPKAMIKRVEGDSTPYIFLIDEAHNLVDRAREMYSTEIKLSELKEAKKELKHKNKKLIGFINKIINVMKEYRIGATGEDIIEDGPMEVMNLASLLSIEGDNYLKNRKSEEKEEAFLNLYFNILDFIRIGELYSDDFIYYSREEDGDIILKLFCINPSPMIAKCIKNNISTIFFSATLSPMGYFKKLLGGDENSYSMRLESPFPKENRKLIINTDIDTRYRYREESYLPIARYINEILKTYDGNFLVFFPSYDYMEKVYEIYSAMFGHDFIYMQDSFMTEEDRRIYLGRFDNKEQRVVGFAVLGGVFSEGIDLWGDKLKGAIVVGVGLPKISFERKVIEEYFEDHEKAGFHYAYTFPGINKVIQAMGRVIRREEDTGVIVLMDKRYGTRIYKDMITK